MSISPGLYIHVSSAQQKVQFSQYMFNNLAINPAYAGAEEALSLTFINRSQWTGVDNAPTTQTFSAHTLIKQDRLGLGLLIVNDRIGIHKNISTLTNYAYRIPLTKKTFLSMGIQAGIHCLRSDYASLSGAAYDPKISNIAIAQTFLDFGAGLYLKSPRLHAGFSAPGLLPEKVSFNDTVSINLKRTNYFLFSKYRITQNKILEYEPSFILKYLPGLPMSFDVNVNMIYRKVLTLGLSYRKNESIDFLLRAQVTAQFDFGYVYDHSIGSISKLSNGSHELMAHYLFKYVKTKVSSPR